MQHIVDSYRNTGHLHHAYVLESNSENAYKNICEFCENDLGIKTKSNPDFIYEEYDKFLVDDARRLRELQMNKTLSGSRKIFIIYFNFITIEAQNSLLKVLEEPTSGTHFFIVTPSSRIFLDTIKSRVLIVNLKNEIDDEIADKFLKDKFPERSKFISSLVQKIKDEKASKSDAIKLIQNIERIIHKKALDAGTEDKKEYFKKLREVNKVSDFLHDNSASVKQLLEYTASIL